MPIEKAVGENFRALYERFGAEKSSADLCRAFEVHS